LAGYPAIFSPHEDSHVTNKAQKKINGALFEFLASVIEDFNITSD